MIGKPWNVADFEMMYYQCCSGVKKDIIVRRVPGQKLIVWRMFLSPDERSVLVEFLTVWKTNWQLVSDLRSHDSVHDMHT